MLLFAFGCGGTSSPPSFSGDADVNHVRAMREGETWTFEVTVHHPDVGWADYVDGWDVVSEGVAQRPEPGSPFTRLLRHPHVGEQPFTRSQAGITLPDDATLVTVRAHDLVHGWGGKEVVVDLTSTSGEGFEVIR